MFDKYLDALGAAAILDYLGAYPLCHGEAHVRRRFVAKTYDLAGALQVCGHRCTSGCMHGAIREAAFHDQTLEQVLEPLTGLPL